MILDTIKTDTVFRIEAKNLCQNRIPNKGLGFLKYNNNYSIFIDEKVYEIEVIDKNKLNEINFFFLNRNYTAIVNIVESIRDKFFTIEIIFFAFPVQEVFAPFYISLNEKILKTAKERKIISYKDKIDVLAKKLKDKISFTINGENYFIVSTAISSEKQIFEEELSKIKQNIEKIEKSKNLSEEEKQKYIEENQENLQKIKSQKKDLAFSIHGENIHLPVKKDISESGDYRFSATKLVSFKNSIKKDSLRLIKGNIEFKNGLVSERIAKDLGDIVETDGSYLNTWDIYLDKEGNILLDKAKQIGILKILNSSRVDDGYELKIENLSQIEELLNEGDYLSFTDSEPDYIKDNFSWIEHIAKIEQKNDLKVKNSQDEAFEIKKVEHGFITIKTDKNISNLHSKIVVLSIFGDKIKLRDKLEARKRLLEGRSANPLLGLIIEDTDNIKKYQKTSKTATLEPLTQDIKEKIFPTNSPTQNQIDAIDIALNTPDIAIIQGPPGTGKTTVLTAIIERLNQESDKDNIRGQVLVAGFQHDAVENIIQRLDINGIPTPKFGKKSTTTVDISSYERVIEWSKSITSNLKEKSLELSNQLKINRLNQYFKVYLQTPSKLFAIELLEYIINELNIYLDDNIILDSKIILDKLNIKNTNDISELQYIYSLRTTKDGFLDDGQKRNLDLLISKIGNVLGDDEKSILKNNNLDHLNYLPKLQKLKYTLIDRLYPKPVFKAEKPNAEIIKLKEKVEEELSQGSSSKDKINTILANYINELESNPFGLKSMIEEYSYVFSSTTGHSKKASIQKTISPDEDASFDTLIIDEAARVAPMDLLVAMVLAKRRIILVGDHRQLPHMVNEDIIKNSGLSENKFIKESMFGYLKKRCENLEEYDGIKRAITLENQYRTHPLLGEFVSNSFYYKKDEYDERFNSPLGKTIGKIETYFKQELKGIENIPAVWIDVPNAKCSEERAWKRKCEAQKIMEYLRNWILSEEGQDLTFGIITFYRKQVETLESLLKEEFTKEERNNFHNRLKIGTVDSFQGMEFDIVFLSVVRSLDIKKLNKISKDKNPFGFLISKNRLCVSMSRQKKSLIIVGDREFFNSDRAKEDVESLYDFLQLCENKGKVL